MRRIALLAMLALVSVGQVEGSIQDQSHELTQFVSQGGVGGINQSNTAQTIRVGKTGQLSKIEFWAFSTGAYSSAADAGDLILDIRTTESEGSPSEPDTSILAQVFIPWGDIVSDPTFGISGQPEIGPLLISVNLTSFNLSFLEGDFFDFSADTPMG